MTGALGRWRIRNPKRWLTWVLAFGILLFTASVAVAEEDAPGPTVADREEADRLRLKSEAEACVQASTLACASPHLMILKWQSENSTNWHSIIDRWVNAAGLAEVLGLNVKIIFYNNGGSWPVCKIDRFLVFR